MKVIFTGGGTGGHIMPVIAISREIRRIYPNEDLKLFYIGPKDHFGKLLISQEGIEIKTIFSGKIRRYFDFKAVILNIIDILIKIPLGIFQSFFYLFFLAPDLIFNKGGYGAVPVIIAAKFLQIPIFSHESDVMSGFVNRHLGKYSLEIFVSFPKTEYLPPNKIFLTGHPIRRELLKKPDPEDAKFVLKLTDEKPIILILGGSQGSQRINDTVLAILPELLKDIEIIHQCGDKNLKSVVAESKVVVPKHLQKYYHPYAFLREEELRRAYHVADLVIGRAGSGTIFEIAAIGKPSILVPLPESAQGHQAKNAYAYAESGAALVIEEANLTSHFFLEKIKNLFAFPGQLEEMAEQARQFAKPRAAKIIASYLINYLMQF